MFPKGWHPVLQYTLPDAYHEAHPLPRFAVLDPVKYYFIDFGISVYCPPGESMMVRGLEGIERSVPELSGTIPYNPFKADVYILACVFRDTVYKVCPSVLHSVLC